MLILTAVSVLVLALTSTDTLVSYFYIISHGSLGVFHVKYYKIKKLCTSTNKDIELKTETEVKIIYLHTA